MDAGRLEGLDGGIGAHYLGLYSQNKAAVLTKEFRANLRDPGPFRVAVEYLSVSL